VFLFIFGLLLAPFASTGLSRILPDSLPLWLPAVLLLALAAGLTSSGRTRPLGLGLGAGTLAFAVFMLWLFTVMGDSLAEM
jgi:hypothetical protein